MCIAALGRPVEPEVNSHTHWSSRRVTGSAACEVRPRSIASVSASVSHRRPASSGGTTTGASGSSPVAVSGTSSTARSSGTRSKVSASATATDGVVTTAAARTYSTT